MMVAVHSTDVRDELADGIDAAPLPPTGPDGMLVPFEPAKLVDEAPPRLCEYGPCRHYHRFDVQLDAQNPMQERRGGRVVVHARVFHTQVNHYCYPDVGIETVLGAMPVLACNRWQPVGGLLRVVTARRLRARRQYARDLEAWHARRDAEAQKLSQAMGLLEPPRELLIVFAREGAEAVVIGQEADPDLTLSAVIQLAVRHTAIQIAQHTFQVELDGAPVDNLDATINELELAAGTRVTVNLSHDHKEPT